MALYLSYRTTALQDAYSFLPSFMNRICHAVGSGLPEDDHQTRRHHRRLLCELLVDGPNVYSLITTKSPELSVNFSHVAADFRKDVASNYIAAAAAVGNLQALQKALGGEPDDVWEDSPAFGHPLVVASAGNHLEIVRAIVKYFENNQYRTHMAYYESQFYAAIDIALNNRYNDTTIAFLLLRVLHTYGSPVENDKLICWMEKAARTEDGKTIHQVLALKRAFSPGPVKQFKDACDSGNLTAVRMFINEGFVPLRCSLSMQYKDTPIQIAAGSQQPKVVEELLKMGANPDGDYTPTVRDRPLWIALNEKDRATMKVLLFYGANPEPILKHWDKHLFPHHGPCRILRSLLQMAKRIQDYYVCPTTPATQFAFGAADLV